MKKLLTVITLGVVAVSLVACGGGETKEASGNTGATTGAMAATTGAVTQDNTKSREEMNAQLKTEAVEADFVKINGGEWEDKSVFVEATVNVANHNDSLKSILHVSKKTNAGYESYDISVFNTIVPDIVNIKDGDKIKAYGIVDKKGDGAPVILATIVEKV